MSQSQLVLRRWNGAMPLHLSLRLDSLKESIPLTTGDIRNAPALKDP
jgi:hypothetical protein